MFEFHSRSMLDCLDRPAQQPSPLPPLPPRRPREAEQLSVQGPGRQAPPMALQRRVQPAATKSLPSRPTCRPEAPLHCCPSRPLPAHPRPPPSPQQHLRTIGESAYSNNDRRFTICKQSDQIIFMETSSPKQILFDSPVVTVLSVDKWSC